MVEKKIPQIRVCPILTAAYQESKGCLRNGCMWFHPKNKDLQTPDECIFVSLNRNVLDVRLVLQEMDRIDD